MTRPIEKKIQEAEAKLLKVLLEHCRLIFEGIHLPSHDHLHHLRVWYNARRLITELSNSGKKISAGDVSRLLLSAMFHDTGLTRTLSEAHGIESRVICEDFIRRNPDLIDLDVDEALQAIELHDRKENFTPEPDDQEINILKILSICDDIDAYGCIGVLRYAEIYILRKVPVIMLAEKVLNNLTYRLNHIEAQRWIPDHFLTEQRNRYQRTYNFYKTLEQKDKSLEYKNCLSVIESYMEFVFHGKKSLNMFALELLNCREKYISEFGLSLSLELKEH